MKRLFTSLTLSVVLHLSAVAAITTMQLLQKPEKKKTKIMYINPVKLSELRTLKPEPAKPKPLNKKIDTPKPVVKKDGIKPKADKPVNKPVPSSTPIPAMTPYPDITAAPVKTPVPAPTKKPIKKPDPKAEKIEKEQKAKVTFLKKQPYFKNWPEVRIRRLELPPGIKSWEEAQKLTEYFDTQYNWTSTPPELGGGESPDPNQNVNPYEATPVPEPSLVPNPDGTPIPWTLYKDKPEARIYDVRFYKDNTGFIGTFKLDEKIIAVSYFLFDPQKAKKSTDDKIEVAIPDNVKPEQVKHFNLPLTQEDMQNLNDPEQDLRNKEQVVKDIIKQYELLER